jgi:hypothetical protein
MWPMGNKGDQTGDRRVEIDEVWMDAWLAFGFDEFDHYLTKHAAFDAYCRRRTQPREEDPK